MTRVGNYLIRKTAQGYALTTLDGQTVDTFTTARAANTAAVRLITAAYRKAV